MNEPNDGKNEELAKKETTSIKEGIQAVFIWGFLMVLFLIPIISALESSNSNKSNTVDYYLDSNGRLKKNSPFTGSKCAGCGMFNATHMCPETHKFYCDGCASALNYRICR